uniref:hypothetical protein n=1 Tax=Helicobacter pylori TaxID=210 RepID=UPI0015E86089|nr:hypothetical protein [Helicobacter pylori]
MNFFQEAIEVYSSNIDYHEKEINKFKRNICSYDRAKEILSDIVSLIGRSSFDGLKRFTENSGKFLYYLDIADRKSSIFYLKELTNFLKSFLMKVIEERKLLSDLRNDECFKKSSI